MLLNRLEGFVVRFSADYRETESATSQQFNFAVFGKSKFSTEVLKTKWNEHFDGLDPASGNILDEMKKVKLALAEIQAIDALVPQFAPAIVDRRIECYHSELMGVAGELVTIYSDVIDHVLCCFIEWTRNYALSESARLELIRAAINYVVDIMRSGVWGLELQQLVTTDIYELSGKTEKLVWGLLVNQELEDYSLREKVDQLDFVRLLADYLKGMVSPGSLTPETIEEIGGAIGEIKSTVLKIMPYSVADAEFGASAVLISRIDTLSARFEGARTSYLREGIEEGLDIGEIDQALEAHSVRGDTAVGDLAALKQLKFNHLDDRQGVDRDCEEVMIAAGNGAYKLATIGCGTLLEILLREMMHRRKSEIAELRKQKDLWNKVFRANFEYALPDQPATWNLCTLINVAKHIAGQKHSDLMRQCDQLRRARNAVHGGTVVESHFLYGVATIKGVIALLE